MPTARATKPISFWNEYGPVTLAEGEEVHGDLAVRVLADPNLPFEVVDETPAKSARRGKASVAPVAEEIA